MDLEKELRAFEARWAEEAKFDGTAKTRWIYHGVRLAVNYTMLLISRG